ncbi:MAG TPA: ATP-binding protein [Vicinamibacteria bacterium]|nr:ATP-binding protein [Vicinamibacteria bacterium]
MPRERFQNRAKLVLAVTGGLLLVFLLAELLLRKSRDFQPDFAASALLFGLTVINISLLLVLVFVLGRNLVRMLMEWRRGVFGARLRVQLLLVFLLMATAPSMLLLLVGSDLIRQAVDRWFNVDAERMLVSSQALGAALEASALESSRVHARLLAREIEARGLLAPPEQGRLRRAIEMRARERELDLVNVYAVEGEVVAVMDPRLPATASWDAASGEALAQAALSGQKAEASVAFGAGRLARVAASVRDAHGQPEGAIVVSSFIPAEAASAVRDVRAGYTKFRKTQTYREPILAFYRSLYVFPALLVLFGAVWLALYLARRITTPLRLVAEGAERIASGERGVRVDFPTGSEEPRALITSFNRMSERLARSEEEVEFSRAGLLRKNKELEERRRLTDTVLETVGTGVVVVDQEATVTAANAAAQRLLELDGAVVGLSLERVLQGPGREEIHALVLRLLSGRVSRQEREVIVPSHERDRHLAVTVVSLPGSLGTAPGALVLVDDLTPLMRAQKVAAWGEVARKLAHEIKNPLTPIQLSAQRVRKAWLKEDPDFEKVVTECTRAIVDEVEALKNLVDEFAQFARLPATSLEPAALHDVIDQALSLYDGLFPGVTFVRRLAPDLPPLRLDPQQMKRALINLVDNAVEATEGRGRVLVATEYDRAEGRARLVVADDGPGIVAADRERLFVPHFSTKKRGSGLGLAIVSRIVQEHLGTIRAEDNAPRGARFVVELPA